LSTALLEPHAFMVAPSLWDMSDMGRAIAEDPEEAVQTVEALVDAYTPFYDATKGYVVGEYDLREALLVSSLDLIPGEKLMKGTAKLAKKVGKAVRNAVQKAETKTFLQKAISKEKKLHKNSYT